MLILSLSLNFKDTSREKPFRKSQVSPNHLSFKQNLSTHPLSLHVHFRKGCFHPKNRVVTEYITGPKPQGVVNTVTLGKGWPSGLWSEISTFLSPCLPFLLYSDFFRLASVHRNNRSVSKHFVLNELSNSLAKQEARGSNQPVYSWMLRNFFRNANCCGSRPQMLSKNAL